MKIGIFGDSYANLKENTTPTWVDILSEKYNITNFGIPGSGLFYSINEIKKHHLKYDKIILVVTDPGRLQLPDWIDAGKDKLNKFFTGLYDFKLVVPTSNFTNEVIKEAVKQYFIYLQNQVYDRYVHSLMVADIKTIRPNIILIPSFGSSSFVFTGASMYDITLKENTAWGFADPAIIAEKYRDRRNCHMTAENNVIFAGEVEKWINGEPVHINLDDFVITTNKDFYLKKL